MDGGAAVPAAPASDAVPAGAEPGGVLDAPFLDMLPSHLGRALICLENEDHYVRVHTALGSALILMRMRDAVAQLHGADGERVHRGWWVSRHAVAEVVRRERNISLRLTDGREVPVARANVATLRARGWLAGLRMSA
jgi:DNA-binding LytR/AlgR family response regulator